MKAKHIDDIREFNRFYTRVIGVLDRYVLKSKYSLPEIRVLYEIFHNEGITASEIISSLGIDKSYLSRLIVQFKRKKLVTGKSSKEDGRAYHLYMTATGKKEFEGLNRTSHNHIEALLSDLSDIECDRLVTNMSEIRSILSHASDDDGKE